MKTVGSKLVRTKKGNYALVPDQNYFTAVVGWESGYRGSSSYELITPVEVELPYLVFRSEEGSLGVSAYALITAPIGSVIKAKLTRSGKTYGALTHAIQVIRVEEGQLKIDYVPTQEDER